MSVGTGGYELTVNDGGDLYKLLIDDDEFHFTRDFSFGAVLDRVTHSRERSERATMGSIAGNSGAPPLGELQVRAIPPNPSPRTLDASPNPSPRTLDASPNPRRPATDPPRIKSDSPVPSFPYPPLPIHPRSSPPTSRVATSGTCDASRTTSTRSAFGTTPTTRVNGSGSTSRRRTRGPGRGSYYTS